MLKTTLERIIRIQQKVGEEFVTPLVLDYYIIENSLYESGYEGEKLKTMSIVKLRTYYVHKLLKINENIILY